MHVFMCACAREFVYTYARERVRKCACTCLWVRVPTSLCIRMHVSACVSVQHVLMRACARKFVYTYTRERVCLHRLECVVENNWKEWGRDCHGGKV